MVDGEELRAEGAQTAPDLAAARKHLSPVAVARAYHHLALGHLEHRRSVEAAETLEEALRLLRNSADTDDSRELLLEVRYRLGIAYDNLEEHDAAVEHLGAVADALRDAPPEKQAEVVGHLATAYGHQGEWESAGHMFRRAAELWETAGDVGRACHMLHEFALLPHDFEGIGEALTALEHALALLERSEQKEHQVLQVTLVETRADLLGDASRYAEALETARDAERLAARLGDPDRRASLAARCGDFLLMQDRLEEAEQEARRAAALLASEASEKAIRDVLYTLDAVLGRRGTPVRTDPLFRELLSRLDGRP